eukprot:scaffold134_cov94-Amphora_coffeaeformis.AAC.11
MMVAVMGVVAVGQFVIVPPRPKWYTRPTRHRRPNEPRASTNGDGDAADDDDGHDAFYAAVKTDWKKL